MWQPLGKLLYCYNYYNCCSCKEKNTAIKSLPSRYQLSCWNAICSAQYQSSEMTLLVCKHTLLGKETDKDIGHKVGVSKGDSCHRGSCGEVVPTPVWQLSIRVSTSSNQRVCHEYLDSQNKNVSRLWAPKLQCNADSAQCRLVQDGVSAYLKCKQLEAVKCTLVEYLSA